MRREREPVPPVGPSPIQHLHQRGLALGLIPGRLHARADRRDQRGVSRLGWRAHALLKLGDRQGDGVVARLPGRVRRCDSSRIGDDRRIDRHRGGIRAGKEGAPADAVEAIATGVQVVDGGDEV